MHGNQGTVKTSNTVQLSNKKTRLELGYLGNLKYLIKAL